MSRTLFFFFLLALASPALALPAGSLHQISLRQAEEAVSKALQEAGAADRVAATITNTREELLYQAHQPVDVAVKSLSFQDGERRWSAHLFFVNGGDVLSAMPFSGRYEEMATLPILKTRAHNGDVLAEEDIDEISYPVSKLHKDTILDAREMIGKTPLRIVSPGRPVRAAELRAPDLLAKGATVHMTYRAEALTIGTVGEAMEPGRAGQRIRVRNHDSGKIVEAEVVSSGEVIVGGAPGTAGMTAKNNRVQENANASF